MPENTEQFAHVYDFGPIYDGRCIYCDCRAFGIHHNEPCHDRESYNLP
jgi:hypothetical protein